MGERRRGFVLGRAGGLAAVVFAAAGAFPAGGPAQAAPDAASTLVVHADQPFRPVTHVATGSLYGLATDTVPAPDVVAAINPNTFVQMAPGGHQLPNGEPAPAGDALVVSPSAARAGAKVVARMPDWYPNFPYRWVSWDDWLSAVDTQVRAVQASGTQNISAWELWNEPDWTWDTARAGAFNDGWVRTYREVRSLDQTTPIQGPSYSDNISGMQSFLANAVATDTVPDIIAWHELERSSKIKSDIDQIVAIEKSLGITPRPIDIEEYATPAEVGIPGPLVGYISKFERYGVRSAELAFWNHYGTLGDLLTDTGAAPNGAYWLYTWYGAMRGDMVTTTPPTASGALDAAASVTSDKRELDVVAGGNTGTAAISLQGLDKLALGDRVNVKLEYTPAYGRTTPTAGPITISNTTYPVGADGSISVPVVMNPAYGYHVVVTPAASAPSLAGSYTITNLNSGLALDAGAGGVAQTPLTGAAGQRWRVVEAGSGLYKIVNTASGAALGIADGATGNGATAAAEPDNGADDHLWQLVPDGKGHYRLANYGTGRVLGVAAMSKDPQAPVVQWADGSPTSGCTVTGSRQPGRIGSALDFCHTPSYVTLPAGTVSGLTGDYTVSAWVSPYSNATWSRVFDIGRNTSSSMFLTLSAGSAPRFAITTSGGGGEQRIDAKALLPLNQWSLVTVTVSGTTGTMYVNGQVVGTNDNMTLHPSQFGSGTNNWIGKSQYNDPALDAKVDDFNIYSRALRADEVAALAAGQPGSGDVVHYAFDEAGGATVPDSSAAGRNGTITAGTGSTSTTATDVATADHFWTLSPYAATDAGTSVGGTVPATLSLSLGTPAVLGPFLPGVGKDYTSSTTADVVSTAGDALLTVADPSADRPGRLVNGTFALTQPLQVDARGGAFAPVGAASSPTALLAYPAPVSHDVAQIGFKQSIGDTEPLRTGSYSKTLTFTLSTTTP
jgi:hypothetical protein